MKRKNKKIRKPDKNMNWICRKCGFIVSDFQMCYIVVDLGCPRCGNSLNEFTPKVNDNSPELPVSTNAENDSDDLDDLSIFHMMD